MLSPREKALIVVSYYKGTADNDIARGNDPQISRNISVECGEKILDELGLNIDFVEQKHVVDTIGKDEGQVAKAINRLIELGLIMKKGVQLSAQ